MYYCTIIIIIIIGTCVHYTTVSPPCSEINVCNYALYTDHWNVGRPILTIARRSAAELAFSDHAGEADSLPLLLLLRQKSQNVPPPPYNLAHRYPSLFDRLLANLVKVYIG